ncbi:putative ribonuclease H-like domain-containing protein [Tanacetum coccineum]
MDDNTGIFAGAYDDEDVGGQADLKNMETTMNVSSIPTTRINKDHPIKLIIGDLHSALLTRRMSQQNIKEHCLIEGMQEELLQFELQKVWTLVDLPNGKRAIGTTWVFRNKKDERGIVVRNKARLVAQGYTQEEGINYDEVFAPVTRMEAIWLFLAYASFMGFIVYQMDVNSAFLYGTIEEEVYVCQPPGFEEPRFPNKVYKVEKALYGLHQAPRAWYKTLSTYLIENGFRRGSIDKTLFIKKDKGDILLVQVYVDDIIFGSTKKSLCDEFKGSMHKRFQISSMGELTFFLGLQVQQKEDKILKKFDFATVKTASTLMKKLKLFQLTPKTSHIHAVKQIFRYLKGQPKLGLWYPRDSPFDLETFSDSDYAGASLDKKSTTRGCQFLRRRLISWQCKKQTIVANSTTEAEYVAVANCYGQNLVFHSKTKHIEIRHHFIRDSYEKKLIQVINIYIDHNVAHILTKAFGVSRTQSMETLNESFPEGTDSGSGPRCQDTILGGAEAQSWFEATSKQSNDPLLSRVNTLGSGEDNMKLM